MFVMKYSSREEGSYSQPRESGKFVTLDEGSGGYPSPVNYFSAAHIWNDELSARNYQKKFPHLDLFELSIQTELVRD